MGYTECRGRHRQEGNSAVSKVKGLVADFTVGRLIETHREKMILAIDTKDGKKVARIPVIDYALMGKEYYENEYRYPMDERSTSTVWTSA